MARDVLVALLETVVLLHVVQVVPEKQRQLLDFKMLAYNLTKAERLAN